VWFGDFFIEGMDISWRADVQHGPNDGDPRHNHALLEPIRPTVATAGESLDRKKLRRAALVNPGFAGAQRRATGAEFQ
jgi:hypothetical protein